MNEQVVIRKKDDLYCSRGTAVSIKPPFIPLIPAHRILTIGKDVLPIAHNSQIEAKHSK